LGENGCDFVLMCYVIGKHMVELVIGVVEVLVGHLDVEEVASQVFDMFALLHTEIHVFVGLWRYSICDVGVVD
jgi:hypothetical protein